MSGADQAHDDHAAPSHAQATVAGGHEGHHSDSHGDDHGHAGEALGPIDWRAWGAAVLGIASALLVVVVLYVTIRPN